MLVGCAWSWVNTPQDQASFICVCKGQSGISWQDMLPVPSTLQVLKVWNIFMEYAIATKTQPAMCLHFCHILFRCNSILPVEKKSGEHPWVSCKTSHQAPSVRCSPQDSVKPADGFPDIRQCAVTCIQLLADFPTNGCLCISAPSTCSSPRHGQLLAWRCHEYTGRSGAVVHPEQPISGERTVAGFSVHRTLKDPALWVHCWSRWICQCQWFPPDSAQTEMSCPCSKSPASLCSCLGPRTEVSHDCCMWTSTGIRNQTDQYWPEAHCCSTRACAAPCNPSDSEMSACGSQWCSTPPNDYILTSQALSVRSHYSWCSADRPGWTPREWT